MAVSFITPRLNDYFDLKFTQDEVDFAIPYLTQDIPLFLDPFLLWTSKNALLNQLHDNLMNFFEQVRALIKDNREQDARELLSGIMEPNELGLGHSKGKKRGSSIGIMLIDFIIAMYRDIPQINENGLDHIEEIQFVVPKVGPDRISDITYCILKEFFIKYTNSRSEMHRIPTKSFVIPNVWDANENFWRPGVKAHLPYSPIDDSPIILAPLELLRHLQWINSKDYKDSFFYRYVLPRDKMREQKIKDLKSHQLIMLNRKRYSRVKIYIQTKEKTGDLCEADPFNEEVILDEKLKEATRKLLILEKQYERFGEAMVPPHIALELEDQKKKVDLIGKELLEVKLGREVREQEIKDRKDAAIKQGWAEILQRPI